MINRPLKQTDSPHSTSEQDIFSLRHGIGSSGRFRWHIYSWLPLVAIGALSIGSGFTTYYGMLAYARPHIALLITVGVQTIMFVFAVWLSVISSLREPKAFLIGVGYIGAALVSIFFSFAAFYDWIDTAADRRQSSNLQLRQGWSETFAKISGVEECKIFADAARTVGTAEYVKSQKQFDKVLQTIKAAAAAIESEVGSRIDALEREKSVRNANRTRTKSELNQLTSQIQENQKQRTSSSKEINELQRRLDKYYQAPDRDAGLVDFPTLLAKDATLNDLRSDLLSNERQIAGKTQELEAKKRQIDAERDIGGTKEGDVISPPGEGRFFRLYSTEADVLTSELAVLEGGRDGIKASILRREQKI